MAEYPEVDFFKELPLADEHEGEVYRVLSYGERKWDRNFYWRDREVGLWQSDGVMWKKIDSRLTFKILSVPPVGMCELLNLYVNPTNKKLIYEWDDIPEE